MSEKSLRRAVLTALRDLDAVAVENSAYPGTPDVNCIGGWIELKQLSAWPRRGGIVAIEHFTPQQRVWLARRWRRGGAVYLLLQVGREHLLFDGDVAARYVGRVDEAHLRRAARHVWPGRPDWEVVKRCLTRG